MTKAGLIKALEPYPDDAVIAFYDKNDEDYVVVKKIELKTDITWVEDVINGVENRASIVLKGR